MLIFVEIGYPTAMNAYFGLLFAKPSFIEGFSRILDMGNTMSVYNASITPAQADALALKADINALRADLANARLAIQKTEPVTQNVEQKKAGW